jgi:hypothetical protein
MFRLDVQFESSAVGPFTTEVVNNPIGFTMV